jgi:hypothetical protein
MPCGSWARATSRDDGSRTLARTVARTPVRTVARTPARTRAAPSGEKQEAAHAVTGDRDPEAAGCVWVGFDEAVVSEAHDQAPGGLR